MKLNRNTAQKSLWKHPDTNCVLCGTEVSWDYVIASYQPFYCPESKTKRHTLASGKRSHRFEGDTGGPSR